jgi:hypothetical protein
MHRVKLKGIAVRGAMENRSFIVKNSGAMANSSYSLHRIVIQGKQRYSDDYLLPCLQGLSTRQ